MYTHFITQSIEKLLRIEFQTTAHSIQKLPQSGSDRSYYRVQTELGSWIATYNENVSENEAFIYLTQHFLEKGCSVPKIIAINPPKTLYLQEDLGTLDLLTALQQEGYTPQSYHWFEQALEGLAQLQINGHKGLDYSKCLGDAVFSETTLYNDLLYFKYYFLDLLKLPYSKSALQDEFKRLSQVLTQEEAPYFLYRDFQSRNIMLQNNKPYFIDYQGGMQGPLYYDVASLLWQAKANLPDEWKERLLEHYLTCVNALLPEPLDVQRFKNHYEGFVWMRLLQVLGAYGFRGLFERKAHFLSSIPLGLENVSRFLKQSTFIQEFPEVHHVLTLLSSAEVQAEFKPLHATETTPLVVEICSFSYRNGYPENQSDTGGGFVFDCRGIHNPGRYEPYKTLTGRDAPVKEFLEQQTEMPNFLNGVFNTVSISVKDYINRDFKHLSVAFGCTGGQHRSVYAADALARYLQDQFKVKVLVKHHVQEAKNWINLPY